ncbi:hypothetical protein Kpol_1061p44 [Vanderwaltozyma polyspora DSM 70294]|uniref:Uncharacterized protein n=1 Tax=Vanderwaltozyma polyspora (strain ATCC 22028 / DSM 70294 / BCRC 21397 / CBS 2163 / NBRC 10782 / NRRL Y-8283 / UCD 57-17) TaxID=436907 RepID=A7TJG9_VANPO|nr:uncharacterized protein Kpol_1061p44 [Vanderwaltozyma polyspora DSM 70294]EDO17619.1 hypothetical protein Kpol_1061p44 [Vanderwaltozyma polyspora DSM 70294]
METVQKRNYYDVIAGLSAFEKSNDVTLSNEELRELTTINDKDGDDELQSNENEENLKNDEEKGKMVVHGYLGGKVDLSEASNATYDLSHTLLGGYVPKKQLESLSSIDFAHYFHKSLECENALEVYDLLVGNEYRHVQQQQYRSDSQNKDGNVRKVVICKNCKSRFTGPNRMKSLYKHNCNNTK